MGLQFAILFAGSIVIERVFFLPGLGKLVYQAVSSRDLVTVRDAIGSGRGRLVATAAGAILGAMIGNSVGRSLDEIDRRHAAEAEQQALEYSPIGADIAWQNPDSGNYGVVTPTRTYRSSAGAYCREYSHTVHIGGTPSQAYGRACRQPDGSWQIEN